MRKSSCPNLEGARVGGRAVVPHRGQHRLGSVAERQHRRALHWAPRGDVLSKVPGISAFSFGDAFGRLGRTMERWGEEMRKRHLILGLAALAFLVGTEPGWAQSFDQSAVSITGDPAPGTGGGSYVTLGRPVIGDTGDVVFQASVTGGTAVSGVFRDSGGLDGEVAVAGDPAPGTGGGTYSLLDVRTALNAGGDVLFRSAVVGGTTGAGIFVASGASDRTVVLEGDPAPGTGGGVYDALSPDDFHATSNVVFRASVSGGTAGTGIFLDVGGVDSAVAVAGDPAPGTGGGIHSILIAPASANANGDVLFQSRVTGGSASYGVFLDSGGVQTAVVVQGQVAPGTGGGIYGAFSPPSFNDSRDVVVQAGINGGTVSSGIFLISGGAHTVLALPGDPAPGTGGESFVGFGAGPVINASGDVVFRASVTSGAQTLDGIFVASGGAIRLVALEGQTAPGTGGKTYTHSTLDVFDVPSINDSGVVAYRAWLSGTNPTTGVFRATPLPPLPGLQGPALGGLAGALGLAAAASLRASTRRSRASAARRA